jgi:DNA-binding transcriptional MerR regulator
MQVGEVATLTGASVRAIRYYERAGLLQASRRANGYREFDDGAVERVRVIRELLGTGFTVDDILSLSSCLPDATRTTPCRTQAVSLYREKLAKIDGQLRTLMQLRGRIEERIAALQPRC